MYKVKVRIGFRDKANNNEYRAPGTVFNIDTKERLQVLLGDNQRKTRYVELVGITKQCSNERKGKKIIIYQNYLYFIGGIETFLFNLTKTYCDRNITIKCGSIDKTQMYYLSQYCDVEIDDGQPFKCDVLILGNYNCEHILDRAKATKVYQMMHTDWRGLTQLPGWHNFKWEKDKRINDIICVSDEAAMGLKETMGYDSKVIYNILDDNYQTEEGLTFITLCRATQEKGMGRIVKMAQKMKEANKKFIWFLCCSLDQLRDRQLIMAIHSIPEFVIIPPGNIDKTLIKHCDYLVQLSDTESFCYSAYEALQRNVPVILTDFPEARNIIDDGENGFILNMDLSNLDIERIFNNKPKATYYIDRCNKDLWEKTFKGEL